MRDSLLLPYLFFLDVYTLFDLIQCARWMRKNERVHWLINIFMVFHSCISFSLSFSRWIHVVFSSMDVCYNIKVWHWDHCFFVPVHSTFILLNILGDFLSLKIGFNKLLLLYFVVMKSTLFIELLFRFRGLNFKLNVWEIETFRLNLIEIWHIFFIRRNSRKIMCVGWWACALFMQSLFVIIRNNWHPTVLQLNLNQNNRNRYQNTVYSSPFVQRVKSLHDIFVADNTISRIVYDTTNVDIIRRFIDNIIMFSTFQWRLSLN